MEDKDVYVKLRGEQESWDTSLLMTEQDALQIQNLLQSTRLGMRIGLPSIDGVAEINRENLKLTYQEREVITVPLAFARPAIEQAIDTAAEIRKSNVASEFLWDWVNKRYDETRVLTVAAGEQVDATLLKNANEHIAVQLSDGSVAITSVMNEHEIPAMGRKVVLSLDEVGNTIISAP